MLLALVVTSCAGRDRTTPLAVTGAPPDHSELAAAPADAAGQPTTSAPAVTVTSSPPPPPPPPPTAVATTSTSSPPPPPTTAPPAPVSDGLAAPLERPWADHFVVAHAERSSITVATEPDGPAMRTFVDPTPEGVPLVFLVRGASADGRWLHIQLPIRPNGAMGWVLRDEVTLTQVRRHVVVSLSQNRVTVYEGERPLLELPVSVGASSSPTPTGTFYVDALHQVIDNQDGVYGPFQISFTGYSTVYTTFAGGIGQVAFHGTNRPDLIGQPASHGCVRLSNPDVIQLSRLLPIGTPVEVIA